MELPNFTMPHTLHFIFPTFLPRAFLPAYRDLEHFVLFDPVVDFIPHCIHILITVPSVLHSSTVWEYTHICSSTTTTHKTYVLPTIPTYHSPVPGFSYLPPPVLETLCIYLPPLFSLYVILFYHQFIPATTTTQYLEPAWKPLSPPGYTHAATHTPPACLHTTFPLASLKPHLFYMPHFYTDTPDPFTRDRHTYTDPTHAYSSSYQTPATHVCHTHMQLYTHTAHHAAACTGKDRD